MKETLSTSQAARYLLEDEYAHWSRPAAYAIIEWHEQLEEDTGEEIEFDRVAIRCDFSEYTSLEDWYKEYFGGADELRLRDIDEEDQEDAIREHIQDNGTLIEFDGGAIVSSF